MPEIFAKSGWDGFFAVEGDLAEGEVVLMVDMLDIGPLHMKTLGRVTYSHRLGQRVHHVITLQMCVHPYFRTICLVIRLLFLVIPSL